MKSGCRPRGEQRKSSRLLIDPTNVLAEHSLTDLPTNIEYWGASFAETANDPPAQQGRIEKKASSKQRAANNADVFPTEHSSKYHNDRWREGTRSHFHQLEGHCLAGAAGRHVPRGTFPGCHGTITPGTFLEEHQDFALGQTLSCGKSRPPTYEQSSNPDVRAMCRVHQNLSLPLDFDSHYSAGTLENPTTQWDASSR